jgi:restriction endonuclease Mrr
MNASQNVKSVSSIEQHINGLQLSPQQRNEVLHAARLAELIVDTIVWAGGKLQRVIADVREADAEVLGR